jgi:hypothetical protein
MSEKTQAEKELEGYEKYARTMVSTPLPVLVVLRGIDHDRANGYADRGPWVVEATKHLKRAIGLDP